MILSVIVLLCVNFSVGVIVYHGIDMKLHGAFWPWIADAPGGFLSVILLIQLWPVVLAVYVHDYFCEGK